ncbi:C-type lectin lectoxin-Enh2-like isoform X2 [Hemiscyllium ocellatum]|uniref:C-type lectin lectoxin-Enh2-like isoform X2 n=1 Tax=Hemiscyllium ocellatum TaxID=170820 RepID=UPI0029662BC4|nr:C-type lectin lectoxin-Enh2-like isoform X2 [Hemiscyllium ocellatum]
MKLIGVLLLSVLLISNAADAQLTLNSTRMDQDLEKRSLNGKGDCPGGFVYFGYCYKFVSQPKTWIDAEENSFLWTDGSSSDFTHWAKNQPDNSHGKEHCVHFFAWKPDWNDLPCDSKLCFLCSYKLPSPCCE